MDTHSRFTPIDRLRENLKANQIDEKKKKEETIQQLLKQRTRIERRFAIVLSTNRIVEMQRDLEELEDVLGAMFYAIWAIVTQSGLHDTIQRMSETSYLNEASFITEGYVINEKFSYPHLLVQEVVRKVREDKKHILLSEEKRRMVGRALILTLWNSWNISEVRRLGNEIEKQDK